MFTVFHDSTDTYMIQEACLGGDLCTALSIYQCFNEYEAKFVAACVTEAFEYFHVRGIIYRDLKPENLLLDSRGYVKLADLGLAKAMGIGKKTWSFCGTSLYIAPEMIRKKGHDRGVDYWTLGIVTYELLTGR